MLSKGDERRSALKVMGIVLLFLFADLMLPQSVPNWSDDLEDSGKNWAQTQIVSGHDVGIESGSPVSNFEGNESFNLGFGMTGDGRYLVRFNTSLNTSHSISSAHLQIYCVNHDSLNTDISIYSAPIKSAWNATQSTWQNSLTSVLWNENGADGQSDRGVWEPPYDANTNGTYRINVTKITQDAAANNETSVDIILAGTGAQYECSTSENQTAHWRPTLDVIYTSSTPGTGGTLDIDFIEDGAALMDTSSFILMAAKTPNLSYANLSGNLVEVQLSYSEEYMDDFDESWFYRSNDNSSFFSSSNSTSGMATVPASHSLSNGSIMHCRMRAVDSTHRVGDWVEVSFILPELDVTDNGDGTATYRIATETLYEDAVTIEDTYVDSDNRNIKYGDYKTLKVGMDTNDDQYGYLKINLAESGIHSNATIVDATLELTRSSYNGSANLSIHVMDESVDWIESQANWRRAKTGSNWNHGGRDFLGSAVDIVQISQPSSSIEYNLTQPVQLWLDDTNSADFVQFGLVSRGLDESHQANTDIVLHSTEANQSSDRPVLEVTYSWGSGSPAQSPELTGPEDAKVIWEQVGHNLSGSLTPELTWNSTLIGNDDIYFQMATDSEFRDVVLEFDTRIDNRFNATDGSLNITSSDALESGYMYHWRMMSIESDGHLSEWSNLRFLASNISSTWLGGDLYELRLRHGNATLDGKYSECEDTYINSGSSNSNYNGVPLQVMKTTTAQANIIIGCDLNSHELPSGYAVRWANLSLKVENTVYGNPNVGVWELLQNNWTEEGATWLTYDGTNNWGSQGAFGWERGGMLSTQTISSSASPGDVYTWNVTSGVQNAMRVGGRSDFLLGVTNQTVTSTLEALFHSNMAGDVNDRAELRMVYMPGSNAIPSSPTPVGPLNGSWSVESGIAPESLADPLMNWSMANTTGVGGYAIQFDTQDTFDSSSMELYTSWNDAGFDLINRTYQVQNDLEDGKVWYWRVRAVSSTNQIGSWSNTFEFKLPDMDVHKFSSSVAAIELHHETGMPELGLPSFSDTWVVDSGSDVDSQNADDDQLLVGVDSSGNLHSSLIRIPLYELPTPQNSRVTSATLWMYAQTGSSNSQRVSVHSVNVDWNTSANGTTYDGVNNWSSYPGNTSSADIGVMVDIQDSNSATWIEFDVSEAIQAAMANGDTTLSLMLVGDQSGGLVGFRSTDYSDDSKHPWLNMTWESGVAVYPSNASVLVSPVDGQVWKMNESALMPDENPVLKWTNNNSAVDDWRIIIWSDADDEREGWQFFDSRDSNAGFDLVNLTWTNPNGMGDNRSVRWQVQPIIDGILGPRGPSELFLIPETTGGKWNSTDAWFVLQNGILNPEYDIPDDVFTDTYLHTGSGSNVAKESAGTLAVGRSPTDSTNPNSHSVTLISFDIADRPSELLPFEIINATLMLHQAYGNTGEFTISVSRLNTDWNQSAVWSNPNSSSNASWGAPGAMGLTDTNSPVDLVVVNSSDKWVEFDVTEILQQAFSSGDDNVTFMLRKDGGTDGMAIFNSSDSDKYWLGPKVNMSWRLGNGWTPSAPNGLGPASGSTIWNYSAPRPSPAEEISTNWTMTTSNETDLVYQISTDPRFVENTRTFDMNNSSIFNGTYDSTNSTYSIPTGSTGWGDTWYYWRVRALQDHRFGEWSQANTFRVPPNVGTDDGAGNHTVILNRSSIFSHTGTLPTVKDATLDSGMQNSSNGSHASLGLGASSSGGQNSILIEFDLSEMPFPSAMTPTQTLLKMYRYIPATAPMIVSVYACDTFNENSVHWQSAPTCSTTEVTRTTLTTIPPTGWFEWDITSLTQSNVANGNLTLTLLLKAYGNTSALHEFNSSDESDDSLRPKLVHRYVDNVDGVLPPAQPTLISPADGAVIYDDDDWIIGSSSAPVLSWSPVANATSYVVTVANESGQFSYRSGIDSEITGTNFTFSTSVEPGQIFQWWVQAINGSIPGPSSSRWSFAIGDPWLNVDNGDQTYTYRYLNSKEVPSIAHPVVLEGVLDESRPDSVWDEFGSMRVGDDCGYDSSAKACHLVLSLDLSQIPLNQSAMIHSMSLRLMLDDLVLDSPMTAQGSLSVHRMIGSHWSPTASTWNSAGSMAWGAPGLQAGVDYATEPLSTIDILSIQQDEIWLDLTESGLVIDGTYTWVIIANITNADGYVSVIDGLATNSGQVSTDRPLFMVNYTKVQSITINPSTANMTDADTPVQFNSVLNELGGGVVSGTIEWFSDDGVIDNTGQYTPDKVGNHTIMACFGAICNSHMIEVIPGAPTTLVVTPLDSTITADQNLVLTAYVMDANSNLVPGQTITYVPSNGSMVGSTFMPWSSGDHTIDVSWGAQTVTVNVTVEVGVPHHWVVSGCEAVVAAGTTCSFTLDLYDQFDNLLSQDAAGNLTWSVEDGSLDEGTFTFEGDKVGTWKIEMNTTTGLGFSQMIEVTHGEIDDLEIIANLSEITTDDSISLNVTRIDIRGNRMRVSPTWEETSECSHGGTVTGGLTTIWEPISYGNNKCLRAVYEGVESSIVIRVNFGAVVGVMLLDEDGNEITGNQINMTTDESFEVKAKLIDAKNNNITWSNVSFRVDGDPLNNRGWLPLKTTDAKDTTFSPKEVSLIGNPYKLIAVWTDENDNPYEVFVTFNVDHGVLKDIELSAISSQGSMIDGGLTITADDKITVDVTSFDQYDNPVDQVFLTWELINSANESDVTDLTGNIGSYGYWEASTVGTYTMEVTARYNPGAGEIVRKKSFTFNVIEGDVVKLEHVVSASSLVAGDKQLIEIYAWDADDNMFRQEVVWTTSSGINTSDIIADENTGDYTFTAGIKGEHSLTYSYGGIEGTWNVAVVNNPTVYNLKVTLSATSVEQQESLTIEIEAFDEWGNEITLGRSNSVDIDANLRSDVTYVSASGYKISPLDEGTLEIIVTVDGVSENYQVKVEGTIGGFFAAGGTLYYVGAGLIGLIIVVLLVVIVLVLRSDSDDYDDYDDDYDDDDDGVEEEEGAKDYVSRIVDVADQAQEETYEGDDSYRVDEDGTEWWEDEHGTWWFREPGQEDWSEWSE